VIAVWFWGDRRSGFRWWGAIAVWCWDWGDQVWGWWGAIAIQRHIRYARNV